jgi:hypothetical protein
MSGLCAILQAAITRREDHHKPDGTVLAAVCVLLYHGIRSRKTDELRLLAVLLGANISYLEKLGLFRQQTIPVQKLHLDRNKHRNISGCANASQNYILRIKNADDEELQFTWLTWLKEENCRRLAWAHLVYSSPILLILCGLLTELTPRSATIS